MKNDLSKESNSSQSVALKRPVLDVAILLSDMDEVKALSYVFKKIGVAPYYYRTLSEFWAGTLEKVPTLAIVDVKLMSEGKLILQDHPLMHSGRLPLVFFYSEESRPLLTSTVNYNHFGVVKRQAHYEAPLKSILKRVNQSLALENEVSRTKIEWDKSKSRVVDLQNQLEQIREQAHYWNELKRICFSLEKERDSRHFQTSLANIFKNWAGVSRFSVLELSATGNKLISPPIPQEKYLAFPSLWLGERSREGIGFVAQNLANQVAVDLMGGALVSLLIKGRFSEPELMVFVETNDEYLMQFDWEYLEAFLSGLYSSMLVNEFQIRAGGINGIQIHADKKILTMAELFSVADECFYQLDELGNHSSVAMGRCFLGMHLDGLSQVIKKYPGNRFLWARFASDFSLRLNQLSCASHLRICQASPTDFVIVHDRAELKEEIFQELKLMAARFSYWRYFENSDQVFTLTFNAVIRFLPASAEAIQLFLSNPQTSYISSERSLNQDNSVNLVAKKNLSRSAYDPKKDLGV